jgi:NAD(P)-dependent dehydrogenase (short-subunit alcohol dehydrogenase family)
MKSALITGANKAIGLETAKQLSKEGLFVYLGSRDLKKGEVIVKALKDSGFKTSRPLQ